jgi:glycosyltransferase involved in cell wall biosynthesis
MGDLVSVVIPAYNVSRFIGAAVTSVLNQTYKDVEIVVVDDRSTDGTLAELEKFRDRVKIVRHETNQGAAAARNTGVEASRGEIVAFLDGDDLWAPGKLEAFAECFSRHPDVLYGFSDFSRFKWSDGTFFALSNSQIFPMILDVVKRFKYTGRKSFVIPKADMFELLLRGYPVYPSAVVVRKRSSRRRPWRRIRTNEDFDFGLRCCRATDFLYIDEILAMVGRHDANLTVDTHRQMEAYRIFDTHLADPATAAGKGAHPEIPRKAAVRPRQHLCRCGRDEEGDREVLRRPEERRLLPPCPFPHRLRGGEGTCGLHHLFPDDFEVAPPVPQVRLQVVSFRPFVP